MSQADRSKYIEDCERRIRESRESYCKQTAEHERALLEHALEVHRIVMDAQLAVFRAGFEASQTRCGRSARARITVAM